MTDIIIFNIMCVIIYVIGFIILGADIPVKDFVTYHGMQVLMQIEIASICFAISAFAKKNKFGLGLGVVLLLYAYDLMARVIPDLSDYKLIIPFSYANAADILSTGKVEASALVLGVIILVGSIVVAFRRFIRRDLAT